MIIHYNHDKPVQVYEVNSRLPVYRAYYGDGLGNNILGFFTRMASKVAPIAKQLGMNAIDVFRDKGISAVGDLAGRAFSAAKDKIISLVRRKKPVMTSSLPSTTVMPAKVIRAINSAVKQKISLVGNSTIHRYNKKCYHERNNRKWPKDKKGNDE